MLSRALSLAAVTLLIGCLTAVAVRAVENLEAGKSPSQIFAGTCNACHKSPRGLLRTVPASSLPGFLRQHYTTSSDMASVLASFLVSNGAADTRFQSKQGKDGAKDAAAKQEAPKQEAATRPAGQPEPAAGNAKPRLPRPGETPDLMRPDGGPAQAAIDAKQSAKQKQGKKGQEPPKVEEPAKTEPPAEAPKTETAKGDDSAKPEGRSETAKVDAPKDAPKPVGGEPAQTRADPVPAVTPAPAGTPPAAPTVVSSAPSEAATGSSAPPVQAAQPVAPAVAAASSLPPVPPAGPPAPPISQ